MNSGDRSLKGELSGDLRLRLEQLIDVLGVVGPHVGHSVDSYIRVAPRHNVIPVHAETLVWSINDEHDITTGADDVPKLLRNAVRVTFSNENSPTP
jgi:hypothetical protein